MQRWASPQGGEGIQQVGDIISGPVLGVPTLIATGNAGTASKAGEVESFITAGVGMVKAGMNSEAVRDAIDFTMDAWNIANPDCE